MPQVGETVGAADHTTAEEDYENDSFAHVEEEEEQEEEEEDDHRGGEDEELTGRSSRSSAATGSSSSSSEKVSEDQWEASRGQQTRPVLSAAHRPRLTSSVQLVAAAGARASTPFFVWALRVFSVSYMYQRSYMLKHWLFCGEYPFFRLLNFLHFPPQNILSGIFFFDTHCISEQVTSKNN